MSYKLISQHQPIFHIHLKDIILFVELIGLTSTELDTGAALEDELSGDCAELEVPAEDISEEEGREPSAFASPESSPQAIRPAVVSAHKKTRA